MQTSVSVRQTASKTRLESCNAELRGLRCMQAGFGPLDWSVSATVPWTMTLKLGFLPIVACAVTLHEALPATSQTQQKHVLFVVADDLGRNDLGHFNGVAETPVIDGLLESGIFLESYCEHVIKHLSGHSGRSGHAHSLFV